MDRRCSPRPRGPRITTYRRRPRRHALAGESGGDWISRRELPDEPTPIDRLSTALAGLEEAKRQVLDAYRDVTAWGGTMTTTGYSLSEWMTLVGRLAGRDEWRYQQLAQRLPAMPVTAALLGDGQLSVDQAISIVAGTKALSGDDLADVEAEAAHVALARNERGDDPDMEADVDAIVQARRAASDQDRRDRDRLDRNRVRIQPDLWGAGRITEDWADPEGFQTRLASMEHAAGPPSPEEPRGAQLAEGSLAIARAWLAGHAPAGTPDRSVADPDDVDTRLVEQFDAPNPDRLLPSAARPTFVVRIDIADLGGFDPSDPDTLRHLATGSAAFGRPRAACRPRSGDLMLSASLALSAWLPVCGE